MGNWTAKARWLNWETVFSFFFFFNSFPFVLPFVTGNS